MQKKEILCNRSGNRETRSTFSAPGHPLCATVQPAEPFPFSVPEGVFGHMLKTLLQFLNHLIHIRLADYQRRNHAQHIGSRGDHQKSVFHRLQNDLSHRPAGDYQALNQALAASYLASRGG